MAGARRLSGGANMETWAFDYDGRPLILRRLPGGSSAFEGQAGVERLTMAQEAVLIALAGANGVATPEVAGVLVPEDGLGEGFVMSREEGEGLPQKIYRDEQYAKGVALLSDQCAEAIAAIHALPVDQAPVGFPVRRLSARLSRARSDIARYGSRSPVLAYAMHWLETHAPANSEETIVHGDFRMGNLLISEKGLSAVLDWECAHIGDPMWDLAFICTPSWRFGRYDQTVGGFGAVEPFLQTYERFRGVDVDRDAFRFWLIFSTLSWGIICMTMVDMWRSRADRALERAVIGTRVSEVELDLLLLLEEGLAAEGATLSWRAPERDAPGGETSKDELAAALGEWVSEDVIPGAEGRAKFDAKVAKNALAILQRDQELGPEFRRRRAERLKALGVEEGEFLTQVSEGALTLESRGVLEHLRLSVIEQIEIDQPRYASLNIARRKWFA